MFKDQKKEMLEQEVARAFRDSAYRSVLAFVFVVVGVPLSNRAVAAAYPRLYPFTGPLPLPWPFLLLLLLLFAFEMFCSSPVGSRCGANRLLKAHTRSALTTTASVRIISPDSRSTPVAFTADEGPLVVLLLAD